MVAKPITNPVPATMYPMLTVLVLTICLVIVPSIFIYEFKSSRKNRSPTKELVTLTIAAVIFVSLIGFLIVVTYTSDNPKCGVFINKFTCI